MRRRTAYLFLPLLLLSGALLSCTRLPRPDEGEGAPMMFSADTKALPAGVETFRVAMFSPSSRQYTGRSGSYCTETFSHVDDYTDPLNPVTYTWLRPCKVNEAGQPLDNTDPGAVVADLSEADHDGRWGLRWNNGGSSWSGNVSMVAVAPAVGFVADNTPGRLVWQNAGHAVWLNWTLDTEVYVSDPVDGGFTGVWFGGKYVYSSSTSALSTTLTDRRAKVTVRIQCSTDLIPQTHLCDVRVTDRIVSDRFYLHEIGDNVQGFSRPADPADPSIVQHFVVDTDPDHAVVLADGAGLPDISDPAGKNVLLEKGVTDWTSGEPFFLQARDYSNALMAGKRPIVEVKLGADPANPVKVRVPLAQNLLPMHHYVYTLDVTNAYVAVYLSVVGWDEVMTGPNAHGGETVTETPAYLGTVQIGDDTWENGGGGNAEKPVNP
ncbi:MAG: hypothetical protein J6W98_02525 [Bacteroidales bacterium]|nr:hypothetical protein [Bacteroidales bacterium]